MTGNTTPLFSSSKMAWLCIIQFQIYGIISSDVQCVVRAEASPKPMSHGSDGSWIQLEGWKYSLFIIITIILIQV